MNASAPAIATHPVQVNCSKQSQARVPVVISMQAYQVYCHVYGKQEALITGGCRGGFSAGELIAFLYAFAFPRAEWSARVDEAFRGMEAL